MNRFNRRTFLKAALFGATTLLTGCRSAEILPDPLHLKFLRQIVTKDLSRSRCVMWQVDEPLKNPVVEVRTVNTDDVKKIPVIDSSFTDDGKKNFQYTAQIDDLKPERAYEYRITDGGASNPWHNLKTADDGKFTVMIFTDSQCGGSYDTWGSVANSAFDRTWDVNMFVNVGDIVDNGEDREQWEDWMEQIKNYLPILPFAPVMGNHETYSREWTVRPPVAYLNYFATPDNGVENFSRRFYSFDFGAAHFAVLDTQWDELGEEVIDAQKNWLRQDMASTDKPWKIIFMHKDVLQYRIKGRPERKEGFSDIGEIFMPEFDALGIDIVFTGHLHTYRNRGRMKNFRHDDSGTLYIMTGLSGNVRYAGLWLDHVFDKFVAAQPEIDNYLTLEIEGKTLTITTFLANGKSFDEIILQKP